MRKIPAKDATQFNRPRAWPGGLGRWNSGIVSLYPLRKMIVSMTTPKAANGIMGLNVTVRLLIFSLSLLLKSLDYVYTYDIISNI